MGNKCCKCCCCCKKTTQQNELVQTASQVEEADMKADNSAQTGKIPCHISRGDTF